MTAVGVVGATGAVGSRFVEVIAGDERAAVRALVHRWWHTARVARFPVTVLDVRPSAGRSSADAVAAALDGCDVAVSFLGGPGADAPVATALVEGCERAGVGRLVHLGCLGSYGAVSAGRLDPDSAPPRPPGAIAARRWDVEQALLDAGDRARVDVVVVAAPLIYGPFTQEGAHVPYDQVERGRVAVARGSGRAHVVFVDDVVEAVWAAAVAPGPLTGRLFVRGPAPITWSGFFGAFEPLVGRPAVAVLADDELAALVRGDGNPSAELRWPPPPGGARRIAGAIARRTISRGSVPPARRRLVLPDPDTLAARAIDVEVPLDRTTAVLGWRPVVDFDGGMRRTAAYLRWADPR